MKAQRILRNRWMPVITFPGAGLSRITFQGNRTITQRIQQPRPSKRAGNTSSLNGPFFDSKISIGLSRGLPVSAGGQKALILPTATGSWLQWYQQRKSRSFKRRYEKNPFRAITHPIGVGAIIEVFDPRTRKQHCLVVQRSAKVAIGPNRFGLVGGATDAGSTPSKAIIKEINEETSIPTSRISFIGQDSKTQPKRWPHDKSIRMEPTAFTIVDEPAKSAIVYITRVNAPLQTVKKWLRQAADRWETSRSLFVKRSPEGIREIARNPKTYPSHAAVLEEYADQLEEWQKTSRRAA